MRDRYAHNAHTDPVAHFFSTKGNKGDICVPRPHTNDTLRFPLDHV